MKNARILLAGGGEETETALRSAFESDEFSIEFKHVYDVDEALTALVSEPFQLCLVRGISDTPEFAISVCSGAKEAGVRIPIVVLMDVARLHSEQEFLNAGALAALPWDGTQDSMLRNLVRLTVILRSTEENLRTSNDRLVHEMLTIQDARERAEAINAEYVELAENYALAKEELEKLNNEKNKFFSIIAHDLRSPFTALLGFSGLLEQRADVLEPEKVQEFASHINESGNRIFKLLENLLEWARLQMNRVEVQPRMFAIGEVAEKTIQVLGHVAQEKGLDLLERGTAPDAYADPHMIDAVIRNLVNNAIKFTPSGGTITIYYDTDTQANKARISVTDTGVGMSPATAKKLFSITENVTTQGTDGEKGTGLGLLLCKELVERNGGHLSVESEEGAGSTFTFTLPLSAPAGAAADASENAA